MDIKKVLDWLSIELSNSATWWQVGITLSIVLLVWFTHHYVTRHINSKLTASEKQIKRISLNAVQRVYAPLLALFLFLIARSLLDHFNLAHNLLNIAVPLAMSLAVIRLSLYILHKVFPKTPFLHTWENVFVVLVWSTFALHLLGWLPDVVLILDKIAINFGENKITLLNVIKVLGSVVIFILFALWLSNVIEKKLAKTQNLPGYLQLGIAKTIRVVILIIAFLVALDVIGFDLTTLTVLGGALGVGIGFGLQRIASNFISGFILLFDRSIRPNDVISIGENFGWVKELRARYVVIRDRNGVERLIPNENLVTSEVINWSYTDKNIRIKIPVQISYQNDPEIAMQLMKDAAQEMERVITTPEVATRLLNFGDNGINLELRVWINDPHNGINSVRSEINISIWKKFKENGIVIPFPQRDVHVIEPSG
ncbi:Potassium efflux system KefA protein / Small-conductance mechanosensitive channel [hydrothermal vent metagenome]|uniref:Potassium efflux system KefA protein / Small-conductance mechanosensitive channel n=1 Tax=hydrothermal vent metagenome TaxID=652676 RepID=A0A3B0ZTN1_9ZZZZ